MKKHIGILATYSEIMGEKKQPLEIEEMIQQVPLSTTFITLSQLSTERYNEQSYRDMYSDLIKRLFHDIIQKNPPLEGNAEKLHKDLLEKTKIINNTFAFSPQSILNIWKWLLAYSNPENLNLSQEKPESNILLIYYLSLVTNDYFYKASENTKEELFAEIFSNIVFNNHENIFNSISRTFLIYTIIAKDNSLYPSNYLDINKDFEDKYSYSIKEHISIIFGLISFYLKPKPIGDYSWLQNITTSFSKSKLYKISIPIISSLAIDITSIKDWSLQNIQSPWNFQKFREKPLLMINDEEYLPFSLRLLQEQLFNGLFHKIRHIYPKEDKSFLDFYGKPFEKYAQLLVEKSVEQTKLQYEVVPEFRYKKTKDSPDIMLKLGNRLLAIEVKSYRLRMPSITDGDIESINSDTEKMILKPLKQVHDRVRELIDENHQTLSGIDEIYLMVVTQGHFPTLNPYENQINKILNTHFKIPIKAHYHLDIEEFEMLCTLLERKRPIFKVLDNRLNPLNKNKSFKNFVLDSCYHIKHNRFITEQFKFVTEEMGTILF